MYLGPFWSLPVLIWILHLFSFVFSIKMFPRTYLVQQGKQFVSSLQFYHLQRSPFFGTVVKIPLQVFRSPVGYFLLNNFFSHLVDVLISAFVNTPAMLSVVFTFFNTHLISSSDFSSPLTFSCTLPFSIPMVWLVPPCLIPLRNALPIDSEYPSPWYVTAPVSHHTAANVGCSLHSFVILFSVPCSSLSLNIFIHIKS